MEFKEDFACRSDAITTCEGRQMTDPWIVLAFMKEMAEMADRGS